MFAHTPFETLAGENSRTDTCPYLPKFGVGDLAIKIARRPPTSSRGKTTTSDDEPVDACAITHPCRTPREQGPNLFCDYMGDAAFTASPASSGAASTTGEAR